MDRSAIDALKDRTDIVKIIGQYVELRKSGSSWMGRCPFHEDRAPSFSVRSEPPTFVCFGCGEKGDVFKFLMLRERVSFPEAFRLVNGPEFKPMSPPLEPRKVEGRPGQPQARKVNWDEPWALERARQNCADCGKRELHDDAKRMLVEVLECTGCGRRVCKRCWAWHGYSWHRTPRQCFSA